MDNNKIYFSLPGYWIQFELNINLINLYFSEREKFKENIIIDSFYDSFPCIWSGGRYITGITNQDNILSTIIPYMERGFSIRHTFTNNLLTKDLCFDYLGNLICQLTNYENNSIIYNSPILKEYIKNTFSNFSFILSTTSQITDINKINDTSENELVVLDYSLNNNFEKIKQLKHTNNIEMLIGETCVDNCPYRDKHYKSISNNYFYKSDNFSCPFENNVGYYNIIPQRKHYISFEDIENKYLPLGINKFKLCGREDSKINIIERYVNYLIKDEYKDEIRNRLLVLSYS